MNTPSRRQHHDSRASSPDPRVLRCVRQWLLAGLALMLVWPAARGYHPWIGWLPLWLLAMPLTAWWALYRFRLPRWTPSARRPRPLRRGQQARRLRKSASTRGAQAA